MNNRGFNGRVDLILRTYASNNINSQTYEAGEVFAVISNTEMTIEYKQDQKTTTKNSNILSYSKTSPEIVTFDVGIMKQGVLKLFGEKTNHQSIKIPIYKTYETNDQGELFLHHSDVEDLYIYDLNMVKQTGFNFNSESGFVSGLSASAGFLCVYNIQQDVIESYNMRGLDLPYLTAEAVGSLNVNGESRRFKILFPRIAVSNAPVVLFNEDSFANTQLEFVIIDGPEIPGVQVFIY